MDSTWVLHAVAVSKAAEATTPNNRTNSRPIAQLFPPVPSLPDLSTASRRWALWLGIVAGVAIVALTIAANLDGFTPSREHARAYANAALTRRIVVDEILIYGELDLADSVVAPGAFIQTPDGVAYGPDGLRAVASALHGSVDHLRLGIESVETEGEVVRMRWVLTGTIREPVLGLDATSELAQATGELVVHVRDGLVYDLFIVPDGPVQPIAAIAG